MKVLTSERLLDICLLVGEGRDIRLIMCLKLLSLPQKALGMTASVTRVV